MLPRQRQPLVAWPGGPIDQLGAVKEAVVEAAGTVEEVASRFKGARRALVERRLETLRILAEVRRTEDGRYHAAERVAEVAP